MRLVKHARALAGLIAVVGLSACHPHHVRIEKPQEVRNGSVLTLTQNLSLPAGTPLVYFQDQQRVTSKTLRPSYSYCRFGRDDGANTAREVRPNSFVVNSVDYDEQSVGAAGEPVSSTRMNLKTELGEQGYHLSCMLPASAGYARFVTVDEIQGAIGGFFLFNPAD